MSKTKYPQPSLTVDIVLFRWYRSKLNILLIKRKANPFKDCWALPGGFASKDEPTHIAAHRELEEETNLQVPHLAPLTLFDEPERDPRGWTISMVYWGIVKAVSTMKAGTDAKEAKWFLLDDLPKLSFDHSKIIDYATNSIKNYAQSASSLLTGVGDIPVQRLKAIVNYIQERPTK